MKTCLVALTMTAMAGAAFAQSGSVPLQRGVSVQQPVAINAATVPDADTLGAVVVALTDDGSVYVGGDRIAVPDLADRVSSMLSARNEKTAYIKADARVAYAHLVTVMDAMWTSGIEGLTLLTAAQPDPSAPRGTLLSPKGLEMKVINR